MGAHWWEILLLQNRQIGGIMVVEFLTLGGT